MSRGWPCPPLVAGLLLVLPATGRAYCPSYTASSPANTHSCAIEAAPGDNPTTAEWNDIFAVVSGGPAAWGAAGPSVPDLTEGCHLPEAPTSVPARFPCELLKALALVESGWKQFCVPETPADQVGKSSRTIISFDCGYGVGQVTSGMHVGESPGFDRERVAGDPTYNLATGTRILGDKWRAVGCVGDRQPTVIEHWYSATWAYNGLAYSNNPNNPNYDSNRGVWNPAVGGAAPYQEKVWGYIEHATRWTPTALAYPALADIGNDRAPGALPEPACGSPTSCATQRSTHVTSCAPRPPAPDAGTTMPGPPDAPLPLPGAPDAAPGSALTETTLVGGCSVGRGGGGGPGGGGGGGTLLLAVAAALLRPARSAQSRGPRTLGGWAEPGGSGCWARAPGCHELVSGGDLIAAARSAAAAPATCRRRQSAGGAPNSRLNARLNAGSVS